MIRRVLRLALLLASPAGVIAQGAPQAPRIDGLIVGGSLVSQRAGSHENDWYLPTGGTGRAFSASRGLHSRLALLANLSRATKPHDLRPFDIEYLDILAQYQVSRGWKAYPYIEAGLTRMTMKERWVTADPAERFGWMPVLGAGLRMPINPQLATVAGVRIARGNLRTERDSAGSHPLYVSEQTEGTRWSIGIEWQALPARAPRSAFVFMRRPQVRGLGLIAAATYAEMGAPAPLGQGAGGTFGASWGFTEHFALLARYSKSRLRLGRRTADVMHRELAVRAAMRGLVTGIRPYAEFGLTSVHHRYKYLYTDQEENEVLSAPLFGAGLLYAIQTDLDFDVGAAYSKPLYREFQPTGDSWPRTFRVHAGFEWRPAR